MRWKRREREAVRALQATFGRVSDPSLARLVTSTGRVGHLTRFGVDGFVGNSPGYVVEVKARKKMLTKSAINALLQTVSVAKRHKRIPLFVVSLSDDVPYFTEDGARVERDWVMMPISELRRLVNGEISNDEE